MPNTSTSLSASDEELRERFLSLRTPQDVAALLDVDYSRLIYHLYIVPLSAKYTTFAIPKRSGGERTISAPATALKIIQQKLNQVLQAAYNRKPSVHSFITDRSIVTNAGLHLRRRYVFNIDLENFYPSINFGRVRGMFMGIPYNLPPNAATVLAQICCFNNELPQGAPTSPIVSNMICAKMDSQLQRLAKSKRCIYSRYADDITFSTNVSTFPSGLAMIDAMGQVEVGNELRQIIEDNGFKINAQKVRLWKKSSHRQVVTGITVNEFPNVKREYVRQVSAMLHAWETYGLEAAQHEFLTHYDRKHRNPERESPLFEHVVKGKIEFLGMVRGHEDAIYLRFRRKLRELAPELVREPAEVAQPQTDDPYTPYETGLQRLKDQVDDNDPRFVDVLNYESQLRENIRYCRRYGNSDSRTTDRNRILDQLNQLSLAIVRQPFNDLCGP